jgi:hypothetical protein
VTWGNGESAYQRRGNSSSTPRLIAIAAIAALAYGILFLDLATRDVHPVNATVVGSVALVYVLRAPVSRTR